MKAIEARLVKLEQRVGGAAPVVRFAYLPLGATEAEAKAAEAEALRSGRCAADHG